MSTRTCAEKRGSALTSEHAQHLKRRDVKYGELTITNSQKSRDLSAVSLPAQHLRMSKAHTVQLLPV
eukprot:SAG31_NODE_26652_length_438_cov_1.675516_1_plen_66_part_10